MRTRRSVLSSQSLDEIEIPKLASNKSNIEVNKIKNAKKR